MFSITEKRYIQELIAHCSHFRPDGLPSAGEAFYQKITLEDIYTSLKLKGDRETKEDLKKGAEFSSLSSADSIEKTNEISIAQNDSLFPTSDSLDEADASFGSLISFIDAQISKPAPDKNELSSFIWLLDEQIAALSGDIVSTSQQNDIIESKSPVELVSAIENSDTILVNKPSFKRKRYENIEQKILEDIETRKYDDKPIGPIFDGYPSRKIILSDPGYGKTTYAKRIALAYAAKDEVALRDFWPGNLFPVLLYCRSLNDYVISENDSFASIALKMAMKQARALFISPTTAEAP